MNAQAIYSLEAKADQLVKVTAAPDHEPLVLDAVATAFEAMRAAALAEGVDLFVVSGFRSIERQTVIWSRKFVNALTDGLGHREALAKVFEYSAAPGWSRHHWGTDLDLVPGELATCVRLDPADWIPGGPAHKAHVWLERHAKDYGFARPYDVDRGGIKPEPWHWSFVSMALPKLVDADRIPWRAWFERRPFLGAELIARDVQDLYRRFVRGIAPGLAP